MPEELEQPLLQTTLGLIDDEVECSNPDTAPSLYSHTGAMLPALTASGWNKVSASQRREVEYAMQKHSVNIRRLDARMQKLGLLQEYQAYKDRYLEWRMGKAIGARGEMIDEREGCETFGEKGLLNERNLAANRGLKVWFPTVQEWLWKRTITYWISVTFFEGSVFFCISSFLYNEQTFLDAGTFKAVTLYGYVGGKVCFFFCTYFMCLETVNFSKGHGEDQHEARGLKSSRDDRIFYYNPFRYKTAFLRLNEAGVWKLPYFTSIIYFTGVLAFTVGLAMEFTPGWVVNLQISSTVKSLTFILGSLHFTMGGFIECIQNCANVTGEDLTSVFGLAVGFGNMVGGSFFLTGSLVADPWYCNFLFAIGSIVYMGASSLSLIMWKDEQFGLSFMAVLNQYHKNDATETRQESHGNKLSLRSCLFIQLCCWCGAISTYNFLIEIVKHFRVSNIRSLQVAFNEFIPCMFSHLMLLLTSAVMRPPKRSPFKQLYAMLTIFFVIMTLNSSMTLWEFLWQEIQK